MTAQRYSYGGDASQWAELYLPHGPAVAGVAVVIHGGYWRSAYAADLGAPLAADLARHGVAAWNLEYRRMGNGGGWPATFEDIAHGIDALAVAAEEHGLDLGSVVVLGHSAGGQLGVWAAGRSAFPSGAVGAQPAVEVTGVVSQSGLLNLAQAQQLGLSSNAVANLLGENVALADPMSAIPLHVPVVAVHAKHDADVPASQSESYVAAAVAAGADARLVWVPGDHMDLIDVHSESYAICRDLVLGLLGRA
ncbi:alpha/beta hydrolase [Arthrobacter sp. HY1533]|uniref:alpha/beta hydrolase n=1 Tax=Arthrobacter sp. HY1533 TaxID=2970919 RepID=UPI0022BA0350|nr:alpha/beta hydrolase [Arthrobacter sp. HY1533]